MNLRFLLLVWTLLLGSPLFASPTGDYIVAVVNSEPITHKELTAEIKQVSQQLQKMQQSLPPPDALRADVLERMINERAQLQWARETGMQVDSATLDMAEQSTAAQNRMSLPEFHKRLAAEGISREKFRQQLRDFKLLNDVRERDVSSRIRVSETEIDRHLLAMQQNTTDPLLQDIELAHILVAIPENVTASELQKLQAKAEAIRKRVLAGEDFSELVRTFSDADRENGGSLGLKRADRYAALLLQATVDVPVGGIAEVVRSGAGFHVIKVLVRRPPATLVRTAVESHTRHILLRPSPQLSEAAAVQQLADLKKRIMAGELTFGTAAKQFSQDPGSATQGGDLGWSLPGNFVPEFENIMDQLQENEISEPIISRFGVHLIQLLDRRRTDLNPQQLRELARNELRAERYSEAFRNWAQEIRSRAFVEFRSPPEQP